MPSKISWTPSEMDTLPKNIGEAIKIRSRYFFTGKKCINNHLTVRYSNSGKCVFCIRESSRLRAANYRLKEKLGEHIRLKKNEIFHGLSSSLEMQLFKTAKVRARKKGLEFTIKVTDIKIPTYCPILGVELDKKWGGTLQNNESRFNKPSLDRLNPQKGYIPDNILVVSYRANMIKGDGFPDEHRKIADFLLRYNL
jgi:hypothetical protein